MSSGTLPVRSGVGGAHRRGRLTGELESVVASRRTVEGISSGGLMSDHALRSRLTRHCLRAPNHKKWDEVRAKGGKQGVFHSRGTRKDMDRQHRRKL